MHSHSWGYLQNGAGYLQIIECYLQISAFKLQKFNYEPYSLGIST
jgi:hypothetical protein